MILFVSFSQKNIEGTWKTIDDKTGEAKSYIKIYKGKDNFYYGKIIKLLNRTLENSDPSCDKCPKNDPRYGQKVVGMVILKNLVKKGEKWEGGKILDPKSGKIYSCKSWLKDENSLYMRAYVGYFFRTQTWIRIKDE